MNKTANLVSINFLKMKLTEMYAITRDPEFSDSWITNQKHILLLLTLGGAIVVVFWQIFDKYYIEAFDSRLPWLRWLTLAVYALNLTAGLMRKSPRAVKQHLVAGFYFGTFFCTLLAIFTGASESPYWYGLFFIIVAWFVLVPYNFREMIIHSIIFVLIFIAGQFVQTEFTVVPHEMGKIVFLYLGALFVSFFAAYIRNRLDAANFKIKKEIENKNRELKASNEELKAEIENHKNTSRQLSENRQFLDNILSNAPLVIWSIDLQGKFTYTQFRGNETGQPAERIGQSALEVYKGTEVETFLKKVLNEEIQNDIIEVNSVVYDTRVSPIYSVNGEKTGYMGVSMDITERRKTENELQKFKLVLEQAPGAVFIMDKYSNFEYINPWFTHISGYTEDDLLHKNINDTLYRGISEVPESRRKVIENLSEGKSWNGELLTTNKNGTKYWANTIAAPFKNKRDEIDGYIVIQQDITEKKQLELALAEQEKLYRSLIEKSVDGIVISQDGKVLLVNKAFADMIGYTIEECIETFGPHSIAPEDRERVMNIHLRRMKGELGDMRYNASLLCKNGEKMIAEFNSTTIEMNGKPASLISVRDITERINMQESIEKSERKYKTLVENSQEGITIIRDNRILFANDTYCKMLGYSREELYNMPSVNTLHPDEHKKAYKIAERRREKDFSTINEVFRMLTKSGEIRECETSSTLLEFEGTWASFFTSHDITENKKIQRALLESEKKYRELSEMLPQTVYELDINGNIIYFNQTGYKQFGLDINDIGKSSFNFIHPSQHEQMRLNMQKTITEKKNSYGNKYTAVRKNGETFPAMTFAAPIISEDKVVGIRGLILDMTEHETMEKALRESEQKYRELTEMLPQAIYELDLEGNITFLNQTGIKKLGITNSGLGQSAFNYIVPEDHEKMKTNMINSLMERTTTSGNDYTAVRADGTTFPVLIFASPMIENGKVTGTRGILLDMSEQVAMENALKESEAKYRTLIEKAMDGIIITQQGKLKFVNKAFCELIQYSEEELIDKPYLDYVVPDDHQLMKMYHNRRMAGEDFQTMYRSKIYKKDGSLLEVELNARTSEFNSQPSAFIIIRDITDRLHTEEELRKAKEELEHLNQNLEIRVKESTLKLTEANTQLIKLQKENLQSQFEVLRQQVNPHFLFNSLNVLTSLIKLEPDLAEQFTEHLSKVYRYVLENKDNDLVSLQTELDFLDAYIFLLHIRFMDKIVVKVNIDDNKREMLILPLALQLLIENAIKHNSMSKKNPLIIQISIDKKNVLQVENNLQERESHMASTGVGLRNIEHRYHLLEMPAPQFLKTETKFVARIPLKS